MFSFQKLLVLVAIILVVWYGFKIAGKLDAKRKAMARQDSQDKRNRPQERIDDLVACPACGTYAARGDAEDCGRPDCPYR